ncbi:MAG: Methyl-accepting chemotaxis protein 4 [Alphaproteobacteria bacterium ADurb.Bin438]|nr:MAG: Methyl-accepting chemotaxis protein 4 [Alphaproteobacteria bacterium ADurb.Bin438]
MFKTLSSKVITCVLLIMVILSGTMYYFAIQRAEQVIYANLKDSQNSYMNTFESILKGIQDRKITISQDGTLMIGETNLEKDTFYVDRISEIINGIATIFKGDLRVSTSLLNEKGERVLGTTLAKNKIYDTVIKNKKVYHGEATLFGKHYFTIYKPLFDEVTGKQVGVLFLGSDSTKFINQLDGLGKIMLYTSIILSLIAGLIMFFVLRAQFAPIPILNDLILKLSNNDLNVSVPEQFKKRTDEVGSLSHSVEVFKNALVNVENMTREQEELKRQAEIERKKAMLSMADDFDKNVGTIVNIVASTATEMEAIASTMADTAEKASSLATTGSAASEQASTNVQTVAAAAEELAGSITEIARQVAESSKISNVAVKESENTSKTMEKLSESASRIGEVVNLIKDVADQTNLLALNATIEAARAGDAGKGFAVVANEVKSLANQTAKATEEISVQVDDVQRTSNEAVDAISRIRDTINNMNEISGAIAAAIEEQGAATQEISRNIQQAAAGTQEVSSNIAGVNESVNEAGRAAGDVSLASRELSEQGERLKQEVTKFIKKIREDNKLS